DYTLFFVIFELGNAENIYSSSNTENFFDPESASNTENIYKSGNIENFLNAESGTIDNCFSVYDS
ncbi:24953_t:CDS:2, partial [Racocetra persica]